MLTNDVNVFPAYNFTEVLTPYMPVFYVSFLVTLILTPMMRFLAHRNGVVDEPDNKRKVHAQPIAYLGGVATFLGWLAGISIAVMLRPHNITMQSVQIPPGVLLGAAVMVLFGLMDDVYSLTPRVKLTGQLLAAVFLILPGAIGIGADHFLGMNRGTAWMVINPLVREGVIPQLSTFSQESMIYLRIGAALFSGAVAIFIILATSNATNLLDGLDGLCSGVTGVMSMGYLVLSVYLATQSLKLPDATGSGIDPARIVISLALLGAVLGFLPFNFNPASIFMGDTGSMFLGYICGTMMLMFGHDGIIRWFLAAIIMFGLPMLDTLLAIIRRKLNGKPVFSPDSNHFHHFLIRKGLTVRKAVMVAYGLAGMFVSFGLVIVYIPTRLALGIYLVLFAWIIVAAFKMGMIFQNKAPAPANAGVNTTVISLDPRASEPATKVTTKIIGESTK